MTPAAAPATPQTDRPRRSVCGPRHTAWYCLERPNPHCPYGFCSSPLEHSGSGDCIYLKTHTGTSAHCRNRPAGPGTCHGPCVDHVKRS